MTDLPLLKVTKRPVTVEAVEFNGTQTRAAAILLWMRSCGVAHVGHYRPSAGQAGGSLFLDTGQGVLRADAGDFVIRGVKGEFYPCPADVFAQTYEIVP